MSPPSQCESRMICRCLGVTEDELARAVAREGLQTVREVTCQIKAGDGCTGCHRLIKEFLASRGGRS